MAGDAPSAFSALREKHIRIGILAYANVDQIDVTGPFEVLARIPEASVELIGVEPGPVTDFLGLTLLPHSSLADAREFDVLQIPGGPGQEALMRDERVASFIRRHFDAGRPVFSVCTGALLCGAAGILVGRRATTHWSALELLSKFGAIPVEQRVVVDGSLVTAAGVTAGIDGALTIADLLRGPRAAQRIQLDIQYAPDPPFSAGEPSTAPPDVYREAKDAYAELFARRAATARELGPRVASERIS